MSEVFKFNPLSSEYKKPFGAVPCGEEVSLRVKAERAVFSSVTVVLITPDGEKRLPLEWSALEGGYDVYSCSFNVPEAPGIVWYYFEATDFWGNVSFFGKEKKLLNHVPSAFQITVYSNEYETPAWFSEGVTYHVFVDRFNRSQNTPLPEADEYFIVHQNTRECPVYLPNERNIIENRDIYGGNLAGILEKLPYLDSLGVTTLYLSPVFEAWSNHKYNTADYLKIDPHFGSENDLKELCEEAKALGIRVILDGVFSHTGCDSVYFNKQGRYASLGAYQSHESPYRSWYEFRPDGSYASWWGIDTLPQTNELNENYLNFIVKSDDSVISHWMDVGVSGWRLDVADELPDDFIEALKAKARSKKSDALVIGEVWEDASTKEAYGVKRKYFTHGTLDGVMNYPIKNAILAFVSGRTSAEDMARTFYDIMENYPPQSKRCLMNIIGTHDTPRAINELTCGALRDATREFRANHALSPEELKTGKIRLREAAVLQYFFPGSPCIYYGDEIGMQGFEDPFNRRYYDWDNQDEELLCFYRTLGEIKKNIPDMHSGDLKILHAKGDVFIAERGDNAFAAINRGGKSRMFKLRDADKLKSVFGNFDVKNGLIFLPANSASVFLKKEVYSKEFRAKIKA